ncbi:hypothetical protein CERZMDRAFT_85422 [Cercospora zeae-maydis SCOH1-5]|uniref:Uncharacterized protein n=1 Tax=Cercospora zeae-maydis SCOH1-5 TaxID=717836 RepID=A0A6A6FDB0_9PEZI|nr:hypothetical protein CERZMDRAFT_85422 [Cercospora zeae-maydis SCOH1-5]
MNEWMRPGLEHKNSKQRRLFQVFEGSRLWPDQPIRIEYEHHAVDLWVHDIVFLGTINDEYRDVQAVLPHRPGQEVVCIEAVGQPATEDCGGTREWDQLKHSNRPRTTHKLHAACAHGVWMTV